MRWIVIASLFFAACGTTKAAVPTETPANTPAATATEDICTSLQHDLALAQTNIAATTLLARFAEKGCMRAATPTH